MTMPKSEIEVISTERGWIFRVGDRQSGPYATEETKALDFEKGLAKEFNVSLQEVFKALYSIPEQLKIEGQDPAVRFIAEAGQGPEVPSAGFIFFEEDRWIAAESTYFFGTLQVVEGEGEKEQVEVTQGLQRVFLYSLNGQRQAILADEAVFPLGNRFLRPDSRTVGSSGPQTLMSLQTAQRFLRGETADLQELHRLLVSSLKHFSNLAWDSRLFDVVSCIIISSYFFDLFGVFPIVILMGPFESGKSRLLLCIILMGHRGMPVLDPSEASIFRTAEAWRSFLGIDEFWAISPEIERLLRAMYKKGMKVPRMDRSSRGAIQLSLFEVFAKVSVATQEPPPPNILSKGILVRMRKMPDPNPEKRDPEPRDFEEFRAKAYIARLTCPPEVRAVVDRLDRETLGLAGRDYEVWKGPLTIAKMLGGTVEKNVLDYALETCKERQDESYEELGRVLEAILSHIRYEASRTLSSGPVFPIEFTPKQLHDSVWEELKDQYRVMKERQEVGSRDGDSATERYDYDTRSFERVYNTRRIGGTYLQQLGLKGSHKRNGTKYRLSSALEFHELVQRYYPGLQRDPDYEKLVLIGKLGDTSETSSPLSPMSPDPDLRRKNVGQTVTTRDPVTTTSSPTESDNRVVTEEGIVTGSDLKIPRENVPGDSGDEGDSVSEVPAVSTGNERTVCDIPSRGKPCGLIFPDQSSYRSHIETYRHDKVNP